MKRKTLGMFFGNTTTTVPFTLTRTPTEEGVYLPEGREFFACVKLETQSGHFESCAPGRNDGQEVIGVHIPLSPDTSFKDTMNLNMSGMEMN